MFALDSNKNIISIKEAKVKIDYFCANCGGRLRVRNGKVKIKHFYHLSNDCGDRGESLVHRYWKEVISKLKKFRGYNIIDSKVELALLDNSYIPDVVLKTDKKEYIIVEICYKNPKTSDYLKKFSKLKWAKEVYEVTVDFNKNDKKGQFTKITQINKLYNKLEYKTLIDEMDYAKNYLSKYLEKGGVKIKDIDHIPTLIPILHKNVKMEYRWSYNPFTKKRYRYLDKNSIKYSKAKIYLKRKKRFYSIESEPFFINIYTPYPLSEISFLDGLLGEFSIFSPVSKKEIIFLVYCIP